MKLADVLIFAAGAVIGSAVTWKFVKTKYEQIAQEEIDSVKEYYSHKEQPEEEEEEKNEENWVDDAIDTMNGVLEKAGYNKQSEKEEETVNDLKFNTAPYVIPPDELGETGYPVVSLNYYANGVVTNEMDEPIDDDEVARLVGLESLEHFGEYEDDSVFVRNDALENDFEILLDPTDWEGDE